jgi:hypothetical protein
MALVNLDAARAALDAARAATMTCARGVTCVNTMTTVSLYLLACTRADSARLGAATPQREEASRLRAREAITGGQQLWAEKRGRDGADSAQWALERVSHTAAASAVTDSATAGS